MAGKPLRYRVRFKLDPEADNAEEYEVTPDWRYIDHVEQSISSQYQVASNLEVGNYRWREIVNVIYSALHTSGYRISYGEVFEACVDNLGLDGSAIIAGKIVMAASNVDPETIEVKPEKISDGEEVETPSEEDVDEGKASASGKAD